jgi:FeS assembly SUF system regulator
MLRITKVADYGFVLLIRMAGRDAETVHTAPDLAAETQLPLPMVSKILKTLARSGLLASHRGTKGGYSLARPPETISAAEIIAALEGPIMVSECLSATPDVCGYDSQCPVKSSWRRLNDAIAGALEKITLGEMAAPAGCCHGEGAHAGVSRRGSVAMQDAKHAIEDAK